MVRRIKKASTLIFFVLACICVQGSIESCDHNTNASLHHAVASGDISQVRTLINQQYDSNVIWNGETPLHTAIQKISEFHRCSHMYRIIQALVMAGANCNGAAGSSELPLVTAAKNASLSGIKLLLMFGAYPHPGVGDAVIARPYDADEDILGGLQHYDDGKQKELRILLDQVRNGDISNIPSRVGHVLCAGSGQMDSDIYMIGSADKCKIALGKGDIDEQAREILYNAPDIRGLDMGNIWRHTAQLYCLDNGTNSHQYKEYMHLLESKMDRNRLFTTIRNSTPEQYHAICKARPEVIQVQPNSQENK